MTLITIPRQYTVIRPTALVCNWSRIESTSFNAVRNPWACRLGLLAGRIPYWVTEAELNVSSFVEMTWKGGKVKETPQLSLLQSTCLHPIEIYPPQVALLWKFINPTPRRGGASAGRKLPLALRVNRKVLPKAFCVTARVAHGPLRNQRFEILVAATQSRQLTDPRVVWR